MSELIELTLPNHWASPLINGDLTGMSDEECDEFTEFCDNQLQGLHCLDVDEDKSFMKYHDAQQYALPCDASTFTFMQLNSDYDAN